MGGEFEDICETPQHAFVQVVQAIGCVDDGHGGVFQQAVVDETGTVTRIQHILGFVAQDRGVGHGSQESLSHAQLVAASDAIFAFGIGLFHIIPARFADGIEVSTSGAG